MDRHARQAKLADVGPAGQARIARAIVSVGLDGFAAEVAARYLAGAGVACVRLRDAALAGGARAIDPGVRVEVDPSLGVDTADAAGETAAAGIRDPAAADFGRGARAALRALRAALEDRSEIRSEIRE
jgi:hypothetical protein